MNRLVITSSEVSPIEWALVKEFTRIGRSPRNDLQIEHLTVSSVHCEIRLEGDETSVADLGSTNGTYIDDQRIREAVILPGQQLRLGDVTLRFEPSPVVVAIPSFLVARPPQPSRLADGLDACLYHSDRPATGTCTQCARFFCDSCVHHLRRLGGNFVHLCPVCSGHCVPMIAAEKVRKRSLWSIVQDTVRLPFRRRTQTNMEAIAAAEVKAQSERENK